MARIVDHLSVEDLGRRYRESADVCSARHFQAIWLLAQGRTFSDVASTTGLAQRWLEQLARLGAVVQRPDRRANLQAEAGKTPNVRTRETRSAPGARRRPLVTSTSSEVRQTQNCTPIDTLSRRCLGKSSRWWLWRRSKPNLET
jgi:hypothetical protein